MFIICAVIYFVGGVVSTILLDAKIQPWANIDVKEIDKSAEGSTTKEEVDGELKKLPGKTESF